MAEHPASHSPSGVPDPLTAGVVVGAVALIAIAGLSLRSASEASVAPDSMRLVVKAADTGHNTPTPPASPTGKPSSGTAEGDDHDSDDD